MPRNALKRTGQTLTYLTVERLIRSTANAFHDAHGLDADDLFGEGCLTFLSCYDSFDEDRGAKFSSWLRFKLTARFYDLLTKETGNGKVRFESVDLDAIPVVIDWHERVEYAPPDPDAKVVLAELDKLPVRPDRTVPAIRADLRRRVQARLGGSRRRTDRAFAAVSAMLEGGAA